MQKKNHCCNDYAREPDKILFQTTNTKIVKAPRPIWKSIKRDTSEVALTQKENSKGTH
jgi:hypothetical protein